MNENLSLAERFAPDTFSDVVGSGPAVEKLHEYARLKIGRSVAIIGPSGCGKSLLARLYAKAILCERIDGPCRSIDSAKSAKAAKIDDGPCISCRKFDLDDHPNLRTFTPAIQSDERFAIDVSQDLRLPSISDGWSVVLIDGCEAFSERAFDILRGRLNRPPPKAVFILTARASHFIPQSVLESLFPVWVGRPTEADARALLEAICTRLGASPEHQVLGSIAQKTPRSYRKLGRDLELALAGRLPDSSSEIQAARYLDAVLDRRPLAEQLALISDATEGEDDLIGAIEIGVRFLVEPGIPEFNDARLRTRAKASAWLDGLLTKFDNFRALHTIRELLRIWSWTAADGASIFERAIRTQELLIQTETLMTLTPQIESPLAKRAKSSVSTGKGRGGLSKRRSVDSTPQYLSLDVVASLWNSASVLVQMYGRYLNTKMSIDHTALNRDSPDEIASLVREFGRRLRAKIGEDRYFHLYRHRMKNKHIVTDFVAHIYPSETIETWIRDKLLPRYTSVHVDLSAFSFEAQTNETESRAYRFHRQAIRELVAFIDPNPEGLETMRRLGIEEKDNTNLGHVPMSQLRGVTQNLSAQAQHMENKLLPLVDAFASAADVSNIPGWELNEYRYRQKLKTPLQERRDALAARTDDEALLELRMIDEIWIRESAQRIVHRPNLGSVFFIKS